MQGFFPKPRWHHDCCFRPNRKFNDVLRQSFTRRESRNEEAYFPCPCHRGPGKFLLMAQGVTLPLVSQRIPPVSEETHLRDYIRIIRKRRWSILSVMVSTVFGTALYVLMQPPIYESTVSLLIEPTGPNVMSQAVGGVYASIDVNFDYYNTKYELLKSYEIMREAVKQLKLNTHPEYGPGLAGAQGPQPGSEAERVVVNAF